MPFVMQPLPYICKSLPVPARPYKNQSGWEINPVKSPLPFLVFPVSGPPWV
jgi:hypothetical protein